MAKKVWVAREANHERHTDIGPYGVEENWVPKDIWWEEAEMQEEVEVKATRLVGVDKDGNLPLDVNNIVEYVDMEVNVTLNWEAAAEASRENRCE